MNFVPKSEIHNSKFDIIIEILLIMLLIFTPIAFGSQVLWAFSLMELGILLIIILWAVQRLAYQPPVTSPLTNNKSEIPSNPQSEIRNPKSTIRLAIFLLSLFLGLVLIQMIPLPLRIIKTISPKTYELRNQLSIKSPTMYTESNLNRSDVQNAKSEIRNPQTRPTNHETRTTTLSFFPFATKIEFFKWVTLSSLFLFLLHWKPWDNTHRVMNHLIIAILLSLYGIFEFFSGHRHILNLDWSSRISSVTGTFVNRNYFAGYLLMVIPLSTGFLLSREAHQARLYRGWRHRFASLDGKTLLVGFGLILMILGLLLSASRMGILSLLISFSLITLLFRDPQRGERISRVSVLIFGLSLLWAVWIGLDAVISRFFLASEDFKSRWMIWANTCETLKDFPLLGSGLGSFTEVFSMYRSFHIVGLITHAENDFLQLASEVGFLGAGLLLSLFLFLIWKAISGFRSLSPRDPQRYIGIGGLTGILALMFHSIVERNIQVPANAFLYATVWGIVLRISLDSGIKRMGTKDAQETEMSPSTERQIKR